jgi:integral membrane protein (TIGR00529 family)
MPAIAKILIVFASILVLARLKMQLGLALVIGGIALNLWAGLPVVETLENLGEALLSSELWLLLAITALIVEIGRFMTDKRNADEIIAATSWWGGRHGRSLSLMALPAVIGLIPMPAGALFSAPFVEKAGDKGESRPEWKSAVNYWFRHIWEYWWPLYPGVIVTMAVFKIDLRVFIAVQFPFTLIAVGAGYFFLVRPHLVRLAGKGDKDPKGSRRVWLVMVPLAIVLGSVFVFPILLKTVVSEEAQTLSRYFSVLMGLLLAMVVIYIDEVKLAKTALPRSMFSSLLRWKTLHVLLSLVGVLVFKFMLKSSGLLPDASHELVESGIPVVVAVAALPFLAGMVTGIALGFAGVAFPLVVGLMAVDGVGLAPLATMVLAYGFGYMGMMLSPVHLCFLVTRDYFDASMRAVYRHIAPCILSVLIYCVVTYAVLSAFGL